MQVPLEGVQTSTPATSSEWFPPKDHRSPGMYCKVFFRMLSAGSFSRISSSLRFQLKDLMWQNKQLGCDSAMFLKSQVYLGGQPWCSFGLLEGGCWGRGLQYCDMRFLPKQDRKHLKVSHTAQETSPWDFSLELVLLAAFSQLLITQISCFVTAG